MVSSINNCTVLYKIAQENIIAESRVLMTEMISGNTRTGIVDSILGATARSAADGCDISLRQLQRGNNLISTAIIRLTGLQNQIEEMQESLSALNSVDEAV